MADYTIRIARIREEERTFEAVREALKDNTLEGDWYGDVKSVDFEGDGAVVVMTGAEKEVAIRMNGRTISGL